MRRGRCLQAHWPVERMEPRRLLAAVSIDNAVVIEGNSGFTDAVFTVTLHNPSPTETVTVQYRTTDGTATSPADFQATTGVLTFTPGAATTQTFAVPVAGDTEQETPAAPETFTVTLVDATHATVVGPAATGYIIDDDESFLTVQPVTVPEGDAAATDAIFTVVRHGSAAGTSTVQYGVSPGTAKLTDDFADTSGTLTFGPGVTSQTIPVAVVGDTLQELNETFTVSLRNPTNTTLVTPSATGTIVDNDASSVTIDSVVVREGDGAATDAVLTVARHGSLAGPARVNYQTVSNTADAGNDFIGGTGVVNFAAGQATNTITLPIVGDTQQEGAERFFVDLTAPADGNTAIAAGRGEVWIAGNDAATFTLEGGAVVEGNAGTTPLIFTVRRLGSLAGAAVLNYSAPASPDYQAVSGSVAFAPGESVKTFNVEVIGDALRESDQVFTVTLANPPAGGNGTIGVGSAQGVIVDDDAAAPVAPRIYATDAITEEGDDPLGDNVGITVRRLGDLSVGSTVGYTVVNGSATTPQDYRGSVGLLHFDPGVSALGIAVNIVGDTQAEGLEQFRVDFEVPAGGNAVLVGGSAIVTVVDNDASSVFVNDVNVAEGTGAAPTDVTFTVTRLGALTGPASVAYATGGGSPGDDYTPVNGSLTFAPGEATKTVAVHLAADALQEGLETFYLDLADPQNATAIRTRGFARIVDDDQSFVTIGGVTVVEGDAGTQAAVLTLTRYGAIGGTTAVDFDTVPASATAPADFSAVHAAITFAPGETTRTVAVPVVGDTAQETAESFMGVLSSPSNTTIARPTATVYIIDEDRSFLFVNNVTVTEGHPGDNRIARFTLSRFGDVSGTASVHYATHDAGAKSPADYTDKAATLTFAPGEATKTLDVAIVSDTLRENEESFTLDLDDPSNTTLIDDQGRATIVDDDVPPAVTRVYVAGTGWAASFRQYLFDNGVGSLDDGYAVPTGTGQLRPLPWVNLNRVSITFSQDVVVDRGDLEVRGVNRSSYAFAAGAAGFAYDAASHTATWAFDQPLTRDKLLLDLDAGASNGVRTAEGELLDGEWRNASGDFPSGNGIGGGDFRFRVNVLPGDVTGNGSVVADDFSAIKRRFFRSVASPGSGVNAYNLFSDLDGSGIILAADFSAVKQRFFDTLPSAQPTGILFGATAIQDPFARVSP